MHIAQQESQQFSFGRRARNVQKQATSNASPLVMDLHDLKEGVPTSMSITSQTEASRPRPNPRKLRRQLSEIDILEVDTRPEVRSLERQATEPDLSTPPQREPTLIIDDEEAPAVIQELQRQDTEPDVTEEPTPPSDDASSLASTPTAYSVPSGNPLPSSLPSVNGANPVTQSYQNQVCSISHSPKPADPFAARTPGSP